jgi:nucleoside-diphosphate-sugar epimerase
MSPSPFHVLLIGGTGQISSGIVKALQARNYAITTFNRGQTDDRLGADIERLHGDRNAPGALAKLADTRRYDAVIDMICFNPDQATTAINAFAGKTEHFVFCSTVCTYGNTQTIIPTLESTPQRPHSNYGKNKLACEELFLAAHHAGKFPVTIFRPSHTFGPSGNIINNLGWETTFVDRLRKGKRIIVSGDGHGLWQSAYADDVGVGFAAALGRKACFGEAYNIVGDPVVTWDEYTRNTAAAIGAPAPRIVHIPTDFLLKIAPQRYGALDEIFQYHGVYSNAKIFRDIPEYRPCTPYAEAVRATVAWMDAQGKVKDSDTDRFEDDLVAAWEAFTAQLTEQCRAKA